jgi:hypothetical protein
LGKFLQEEFFQSITPNNQAIAVTIGELNCFGYLDDLSEAEAALLENIKIDWEAFESQCLMSIM